MNIVFVTTELADANNSAGGLASFTANISKIFAANGHHVSIVLATTKELQVKLIQDISVFPIYVPMKKWKKINNFSKKICKFIKYDEDDVRRTIMNLYKGRKVRKVIREIDKKEKIDVIHYCNHGSFSRISPKGIPYAVRISGLINICKGGANTPEGSLNYKDNPLSLIDKLERRAIKKSKYVITPSYLLADIVKENFKSNVTVLESPFVLKKEEWDLSAFDAHSLGGKRYIIHYGSLRYAKGTHIVAQLVEKILYLHPNLSIVLAGKNEELIDESGNKIGAAEYVKKYAGKYADRVIYVGRLVREQLYPIIQKAELCLLPSRIENLSNACIEAMAMGKIVVATNGASYEQLIENGVNGFLCERDNPDSYLKALNEALNLRAEERKKIELMAMKTIERLEPQRIYEQYLNFYMGVIKEWHHI